MRAPPIQTLLRDCQTGTKGLNKYCHDRGGYHGFNPTGEGILSLDWDNLIIFDTCQYDIYRERVENTDHLSTVKNTDRIYTLENGEITNEGSHGELLADKGEYAELYAIQSCG